MLLVNLDAVPYPNLALMHISTWKKAEGYNVGWDIQDPAEIYASCVFFKNKHRADGLPIYYPEAKIDLGGSGISLTKSLPPEVDRMMPDYSLYPSVDYDLGFTSRGCIRNCHFCIVPKKEGTYARHQHPRDFHLPEHKKIILMDNNILADPPWFFEVTDWMIKNNMKVDFNQGLDLRLMTPEIAERLAELKPIDLWHFAFDSMAYREAVETGIATLKRAGVNLRNKANFYVYLHNDADFESALTRCNILRANNCLPYIMRNRETPYTQRMKDIKRWTRPHIFFSTDYEHYAHGRGHY